MALRLTLDIFSGRPNPVVVIDGPQEKELLSRLAPDRKTKAKAAPIGNEPPALLGYRGIVIETLAASPERKSRGPRGRPAPMRVLGGSIMGAGARGPVIPVDPLVEDFICGSTGPFRPAGLDPEFFDFCGNEIERLRDILKKFPWRPPRWPLPVKCRCAPLWEPQWWNDGGQVQLNNNCYNYASNYRSDTYAQPGLAANAQYQQITCQEVLAGAVADKLIDSPNADNKCPDEGHLVALVVGPGWDFHWYRKGRNGYWTHKPGGTQATQVDNSGKLIADPRTADRGFYTNFCTFMVVMHGHVKIR